LASTWRAQRAWCGAESDAGGAGGTDNEVRKAMLAAYILNNFGRDLLEDEMSLRKRGRRRPPAEPG